MLNQVAAAFDRQDYRTAAQLLQDLLQQSPDDPWVQLYVGRLREVSGKLEQAEAIYRRLLREVPNPKLATQARQGIQRLASLQRDRPSMVPTPTARNDNPGFLVLPAVTGKARAAAVQQLARVMHLDAYTAQLLLPSRGWRLYRAGAIADLQSSGQALQQAGIPAVWAALADLQTIQVFQVYAFEVLAPEATIVCQNAQGQLGQLKFAWSEVGQRVAGMLPIFEQVLELGYRDRLERKEKIQDYHHFCDLHLPRRRCILRLHDYTYQFEQNGDGSPEQARSLDRATIRTKWNRLLEQIDHQRPHAIGGSEFTAFGTTAADFAAPLRRLKPQIEILRQTETYWDAAFELYSRLLFWQAF